MHIKFLIIGLLFYFPSFSQCMSIKDSNDLIRSIKHFINASDWEHRSPEIAFGGGPSSAFFCLLSIDSIGKVSNVHFWSDFKNKDSIFAILSKLGPDNFKDWKSERCKGKAILIPIAYASPHGHPEYVRDLMESTAFKPVETKDLIIIHPIIFGWAIRWSEFLEPWKKRNKR